MDAQALTAMFNVLAKFEPGTIVTLTVIGMLSPFGVIAMVIYFWFSVERRRNEILHVYREDMKKILDVYGNDMMQLKNFYEKNVDLVNAWKRIAEGFQETVVLNTQYMTTLCDMVKTNQFCPLARLPK
jgi:hypothetical protein